MFSVGGPTVCNSMPEDLWNPVLQTLTNSRWRHSCSRSTSVSSAL